MKELKIGNVGTVAVNNMDLFGAQIEVYIPFVDGKVDKVAEKIIDECCEMYKKSHSINSEKDITFNFSLVFNFGQYLNAPVEAQVIVWEKSDMDTAEYYTDLKIELSEDDYKKG